MKELTNENAAYIIENGEVSKEVLESAENVAVIFTQDWCPQWLHMKLWLGSAGEKGVEIYYLCYNRKSYFKEFMEKKETVWKNGLVPYVRYYRNGKFLDFSNYVSKLSFFAVFDI